MTLLSHFLEDVHWQSDLKHNSVEMKPLGDDEEVKWSHEGVLFRPAKPLGSSE